MPQPGPQPGTQVLTPQEAAAGNWCLYQTTNLLNGKYYIGVHHQLAKRSYMGSGSGVQAAMRKYGRENFRKDVLMTMRSANDAYDLERLLVNETFVRRQDTYNRHVGGRGAPPGTSYAKGHTVSAQARQRIKAARANQQMRPLSIQARQKLTAARGGNTLKTRAKLRAANLGKTLSTETKVKMSIARIGKRHTPEARANMSAAKMGHCVSVETRHKLRFAALRQAQRQRQRRQLQIPWSSSLSAFVVSEDA